MKEYSYNVGELKKMVMESSQEFKPVLGPNVKQDNEKNNSESYRNSKKRAEDYDGGLKEPKERKLQPKVDGNRTTIEYNPVNKPSKEHVANMEAQAKGYTSKLEMDNGNERGGCEMDNDGKILKQFKDAQDERESVKDLYRKGGLVARTFPDKEFDRNHLMESPKPKRLKFKHTRFVNESQMLARIPEEYKLDGQRIHMVDTDDNEYIVECKLSEHSGNVETIVVGYNNKKILNEQVNRMFNLMGYKTPSGMSVNEKLNEEEDFKKIMNIVRENE